MVDPATQTVLLKGGKALLTFLLNIAVDETKRQISKRLKNKPVQVAFTNAFDRAILKFEEQHSELYKSLFDEHFLKNHAGEQFSKLLYGELPDVEAIASSYEKQFHLIGIPKLKIVDAINDLVQLIIKAMSAEPLLLGWVQLYKHDKTYQELLKLPTKEWIEIAFSELSANILAAIDAAKDIPPEKTSELYSRYCKWRADTTANYTIAGFNKPLPVSELWLELEASESEDLSMPFGDNLEIIQRYHKSPSPDNGRRAEYDAEWLGVQLQKLVAVGGPGAGKSLLMRRIAHRESKLGSKVLLAKLPLVLARMEEQGENFEEALSRQATDSAGLTPTEIGFLSEHLDLLLLDGLDECAGRREQIAQLICSWAEGHPKAKIIVTTRPVGHNPGTLPGWRHFQLQQTYLGPLSRFVVEGVSLHVFSKDVYNRMDKVFSSDKTFDFVRNNPLLFTFVVALAAGGKAIPNSKALLYQSVIAMIAEHEVANRVVAENGRDLAVLNKFSESFAWILLHEPTISYPDLLKKVGLAMADELEIKPLNAASQAAKAFAWWEERRLFERLHVADRTMATFVHLGFGEYLAARYLLELNEQGLRKWIMETKEDPAWKEVYLNAAQLGLGTKLIRILLDAHNPEDKKSIFPLLAAQIFSVAEDAGEESACRIIAHLAPRISDELREHIFSAAEALIPVAGRFPVTVKALTQALQRDENEYRRFAGLALALSAGETYVDLQKLRENYCNILRPFKDYRSAFWLGNRPLYRLDYHYLREIMLIKGTEYLISKTSIKELKNEIVHHFNNNSISISMRDRLREVLRKSSDPDIRAILLEVDDWATRFSFIFPSPEERKKSTANEILFLDRIIVACKTYENVTARLTQAPLVSLAKVISTLQIGQLVAGEFDEVIEREWDDSMQYCFLWTLLACGVDNARVIVDAQQMQKGLETENLFSILSGPRFPFKPDWGKAANKCNDPSVLVEALNHPLSTCSYISAEMIEAGAGGNGMCQILKDVLATGGYNALYYLAQLADNLWGEEAPNLILNRLETKPTGMCEPLLKKLPEWYPVEVPERVLCVIENCLFSPYVSLATGTAEICLKMNLPDNFTEVLRRAFDYWKTHEKPYPMEGGIVPPSPRDDLFKAITAKNAFQTKELFELRHDRRVSNRAQNQLLELAKTDAIVVERLISEITPESVPLYHALVRLPEAMLEPHREKLKAFQESMASVDQ
ncbi:NACHT domain-containing protein [bacterium]|nr:MAG: NACHT domain-containing protein [bacterium]